MSLKNQFSSWFFQGTKSSLTNFFCFNIRTIISLRKKKEFNDNLRLVTKSEIKCILCVSVKVTTLSWAEKISSEY